MASNQISNNKNEISNQPQAKSFSLINKFQQNTNFNGNARTNNNNNSFNNSIDEENHSLMTIAMLSPVCDSNWKIKARILKKNDIKQYKNAKGEGCLFSIEIMDKNQTEISCSFFNNGCDKWFDFLNEGNIYIFSGGYIKDNNSRYK